MENYTISSLRAALKAKRISAKEVTEQYLSRIEELNPKFNVYVYEGREHALKQAEEADAKIAAGEDSALLGVPMGLKDVFTTKGMPTTACSNILRDYVSPFNAPVVDRLYDAGAICLGKVNTDEFTCGVSTETSCFGPTKNPYDESKVPGGSSGGSGALPVLNMGVFAMATDTGGSIRQPSSLCNSVGLKVTYGRVPRSGVISMASSLDTIGHCAKTVEDAAIILNVTAGASRMDNTTLDVEVPDYTSFLGKGVKGLKIGVPKEYMDDSIDDEVRETIWSALKVLEGQGAELVDIELPLTNYGVAVYYIVSPSEVSANMERYDGIRYGAKTQGEVNELMDQYLKNRGEGFGDEMKRRIMVGTYALSSGYYDAYYLKAQKVRTLLINEFNDAFSKVDVIAGPVSPFTAFDIGGKVQDPIAMYMADVLTIPSALAGLPGMSVPAGFDKAGLPIGLQLISPQFREDLLFQTGSAYEAETEFWKKTPEGL